MFTVAGPPGTARTRNVGVACERNRIGIVGIVDLFPGPAVITDLHVKRRGALGDRFSDPTKAKDADRLASERSRIGKSVRSGPSAGPHERVGMQIAPHHIEHEPHHRVGDAVVDQPDHVGDDDPPPLGGREVDLLGAVAVVGYDLQLGQGLDQRLVDAALGERRNAAHTRCDRLQERRPVRRGIQLVAEIFLLEHLEGRRRNSRGENQFNRH